MMERQPRQKLKQRSRDGCQNCKKFKIKCDRVKPTCNVCQRRNLNCDYSKKIVWVSVENSDSRHPSFKNLKKNDLRLAEVTTAGVDRDEEEEMAVLDINDPMINTSNEYSQIASYSADTLTIEHELFNFIKILNPDIVKIFKTQESAIVYEHYLSVTCSSLDPLHGSGPENISQKFFLPVALNDPSTLHGILSISSSQLSNSNPTYKDLSIIHKSLAFKHLYGLFSSSKKSISLEALSAIICQLSIEIIQSGLKNWRLHINALRRIINQRKDLKIPEDQTTWFIYLRVARYDNFASLTTGDDPLFKAINIDDISSFKSYHPTIQNVDCIFGCPSDVLFFCAELSHLSKCLYQGRSLDDLGYTEDALKLRLFEILNKDYVIDITNDWSCIKNLWCSAMGIHYHHCLEDDNNVEYTKIHVINFFKALNHFITLDSYFCANLLWPILKIGTVVVEEEQRRVLIDAIQIFYTKTKIGAFTQLACLLEELWELVDTKQYNNPSDWWKYQQERESWNVYLA